MPLASGQKLAHYEVVDTVGVGGMGEVYRARDTKLGREVAIKVLPDELASSTERLARFEREAQVLASLNHPNIATLHGLESEDGIHFLVMELVAGETLQERIARGPLSPAETVGIAQQITDALEAAHESGVIHRDLKPGNIKITPDETVKVLDFGLAKPFEQEPGAVDSSLSPTLTRDASHTGVILGTASYMSPEQARGKPVDKRSDIFSFGAVLFEMLSGRKAFEGEMVSDILASVIKLEPDWSRIPERTPTALVNLMHRCLEKDPRRRLRDIGDARAELDSHAADAPRRDSKQLLFFGAALGLLAGILGTVLLLRFSAVDTERTITRFTIVLPQPLEVGPPAQIVNLALSPDGRVLVFRANNQLFLRRMDDVDAVPLAGTESTYSGGPFFSPDGEWVGYRDMRVIRKISIHGGAAPVTICASNNFGGADWSEDDTIVFADDDGLWTVSAEGGEPTSVISNGGKRLVFPQLLPGDDWVLVTRMDVGDLRSAETFAVSRQTGDQKSLLRGVTGVRYIETGHMLFVDDAKRLVAIPFDAQAVEITGERVPLVEGIPTGNLSGAAQFAVSDNGVLAFLGSRESSMNRPVWVERDGRVSPLSFEDSIYNDVRLSPEGRSVAMQDVLPGQDIWVHEIERGSSTRLSHGPSVDETPAWSPDGRYVAFASSPGGTGRRVVRRAADGSGDEEELWVTEDHTHVTEWLPDGSGLLLDVARDGNEDILVLELNGGGEPKPLVATPFAERLSRLSPDGHWLAYGSDASGKFEIYVQPFPELDARYTISTGGGHQPVWSHDGRTLYYRGPTHLMEVRVAAGDRFEASAPEPLFADRFSFGQSNHTAYDVTSDGRFLMLTPVKTDSENNPFGDLDYFHVVLNWFEEVRGRVRTDD